MKNFSTTFLSKNRILILFGIFVCNPITFTLIAGLQMLPLPNSLYVFAVICNSISFLLLATWIPISIFGLILTLRNSKDAKPLLTALCITTVIASWLSFPVIRYFRLIDVIRKPGVERIIQNGRPVILAIERYKEHTNKYPSSLNDLVPKYIVKIPDTGTVGYPKYKYSLPKGETEEFSSYEISVDTPIGGNNWDMLIYWSERSYPEYLYGGKVEFIDDWAYVHE